MANSSISIELDRLYSLIQNWWAKTEEAEFSYSRDGWETLHVRLVEIYVLMANCVESRDQRQRIMDELDTLIDLARERDAMASREEREAARGRHRAIAERAGLR